MERCQYVPFNSTFNDSAPTSEAQQFEQRHFSADRHMTPDRTQTLARVLMCMFFTPRRHNILAVCAPAHRSTCWRG